MQMAVLRGVLCENRSPKRKELAVVPCSVRVGLPTKTEAQALPALPEGDCPPHGNSCAVTNDQRECSVRGVSRRIVQVGGDRKLPLEENATKHTPADRQTAHLSHLPPAASGVW